MYVFDFQEEVKYARVQNEGCKIIGFLTKKMWMKARILGTVSDQIYIQVIFF